MKQTYSGVFSGVNNSWTTDVISLSCWNTEIDVGARSIKRQVKLVSTHFDMTKSLNNTHSPAKLSLGPIQGFFDWFFWKCSCRVGINLLTAVIYRCGGNQIDTLTRFQSNSVTPVDIPFGSSIRLYQSSEKRERLWKEVVRGTRVVYAKHRCAARPIEKKNLCHAFAWESSFKYPPPSSSITILLNINGRRPTFMAAIRAFTSSELITNL